MALKLFKCRTGARASEGHVGMRVDFGSALCDRAGAAVELSFSFVCMNSSCSC